jgi:hypothetical protein
VPFAAGSAWKGALAVRSTSDAPSVGGDTAAPAPTDTIAFPAALEYVTEARVKVQVQTLHPDKALSPEETNSLDLLAPKRNYQDLCVSPDGSVGALHDFVTKTLTVYEGSTWPESGLPQGGRIVRVIPEFWQPDTYGGYGVNEEFSPDGRHLLVSWGKRIGALLYDARTGRQVTDPHLFPQNLKEYLYSPDWNLGVARNRDGRNANLGSAVAPGSVEARETRRVRASSRDPRWSGATRLYHSKRGDSVRHFFP